DRATLWQIIETTASALGLPREDPPDAREIFGRIAAAAAAIMQDRGDGIVFPPLSIPDEHYPAEWSPNAGPRLRGAVREIAAKYGLTPRQTALGLGMATGNLIHQASCRRRSRSGWRWRSCSAPPRWRRWPTGFSSDLRRLHVLDLGRLGAERL